MHRRHGKTGIVIGRLDRDDSRFLAQVASGDDELLGLLDSADEPIGQRFYVTALGVGNRVTGTEEQSSPTPSAAAAGVARRLRVRQRAP